MTDRWLLRVLFLLSFASFPICAWGRALVLGIGGLTTPSSIWGFSLYVVDWWGIAYSLAVFGFIWMLCALAWIAVAPGRTVDPQGESRP
jgi:hypothetical protein